MAYSVEVDIRLQFYTDSTLGTTCLSCQGTAGALKHETRSVTPSTANNFLLTQLPHFDLAN